MTAAVGTSDHALREVAFEGAPGVPCFGSSMSLVSTFQDTLPLPLLHHCSNHTFKCVDLCGRAELRPPPVCWAFIFWPLSACPPHQSQESGTWGLHSGHLSPQPKQSSAYLSCPPASTIANHQPICPSSSLTIANPQPACPTPDHPANP